MDFKTEMLYVTFVVLLFVVGNKADSDSKDPDIMYSDTFKVNHCGNENDPIKVKDVIAMPDPLVTPGEMILTMTVEVLKTLFAPIGVDIETKRLIGQRWVTIPCVYGFLGSCKYDDLCVVFSRTPPCPAQVQKKFPCKCPVDKNTYNMHAMKIPLQPGGDFTAGKYISKVQATNWMYGTLMCYEVYYEIVKAQ